MAYTPTTWNTGDLITAEKLNKLEQGVQNEQVGPAGAKGETGATGPAGPAGAAGAAAGFGTITVTVDSGTSGSPTCEVTPSGPNTAKNFTFAFHNLKGAKGNTGERGPQGPAGAGLTGSARQLTDLTEGSVDESARQKINEICQLLRDRGIATT